MRALAGFVAGLVFGLGLLISNMTNPAKILNFLDIFGSWDPSLALVMAAAVPMAFAGFRIGRGLHRPLFTQSFAVHTASAVDPRLLAGSALFGIGWGLSGFCPGPAIVALTSGAASVFIFVGAMLLAMALTRAALGALPPARRILSTKLPLDEKSGAQHV